MIKRVEYSLHFKQKPVHALMEYAIHSLAWRIAGSLTPPSQLACFEVNVKGEIRRYPVLISQTIHGKTLQEIEEVGNLDEFDPKQLTWACLLAILTKPGDGRMTNYVVEKDTKGIFSVDNDISFVDPLTENHFTKTVHFTSALFCIDTNPLDMTVLENFVNLSPDLILQGWIDDLVKKNAAYQDLHLFTEKEKVKLYNEDKENRVKTSLLLRSGTLAALLMQFHHLQNIVRHALNKKKLYPLDLLKALVTLHGTQKLSLGDFIYKEYAQGVARGKSLNMKLEKAVKRNVGVSRTSSQSDGPNFGKLPTYEEIQKKEEFSPEKAREEFFNFTFKCTREIDLYTSNEKVIINADFHRMIKEGIPDTERQSLVLTALTFIMLSKGIKAHEVSLKNCAVLDLEVLKPFLHDKLEILNISGCPLLNKDSIQEIIRECDLTKLSLQMHGLHQYLQSTLVQFTSNLVYKDGYLILDKEQLNLVEFFRLISLAFSEVKEDSVIHLMKEKVIRVLLCYQQKPIIPTLFSLYNPYPNFKQISVAFLDCLKCGIKNLSLYKKMGPSDLKIILNSEIYPLEIPVHQTLIKKKSILFLIRGLIDTTVKEENNTFKIPLSLNPFEINESNRGGISHYALLILIDYFYSGKIIIISKEDLIDTARAACYLQADLGNLSFEKTVDILHTDYKACILEYAAQLLKLPLEKGWESLTAQLQLLQFFVRHEGPIKVRVWSLLGQYYRGLGKGIWLLHAASKAGDKEASHILSHIRSSETKYLWRLFAAAERGDEKAKEELRLREYRKESKKKLLKAAEEGDREAMHELTKGATFINDPDEIEKSLIISIEYRKREYFIN